MEVPQKPYANITKSFVHLAAQICFMKNCWNPSPMTAITGPCTRRYHPTLSIWLSVDPMSDKYPGVSPYVYCGNNPVKLVDPDGREISENLDKWRYNTTTGRLTWLNDEGGQFNQTVEFVHNSSDGKLHYNQTKSVNFNGTIGDMFDFSVVSPKIDGIISGTLDICNGGKTFVAGIALEVATEGAGTPVAVPLCFAGGAQMGEGFRTLATALSGENGKYSQQDLVKDLCKTGVNSLSDFARGVSWKNLFKFLKGAAVGLAWTYQLSKKANFPQFIGMPSGSKITYSH